MGIVVQALCTGLGIVWIRLTATPIPALSQFELFQLSGWLILAPSWVGGAVAGLLAPRIKARHLVTSGLLVGSVFLAGAAVVPADARGALDLNFRLWLSAMLVVQPMIAGLIANRLRHNLDARDPLQPRPYRRPDREDLGSA